MSIAKAMISAGAFVATIGFSGAALALPSAAAPMSEGVANIEKIARVCRPDGCCFDKYSGASLGCVRPRRQQYYNPRPRQYYQDGPQNYQNGPQIYIDPGFAAPRPYYRRDYY